MEDYFSYLNRKERRERRQELVTALKEVAGAIAFFACLFGMCALCTICSGYHWE